MLNFSKYTLTVIALVLVAFVAAACGGGTVSNTPEQAAKAWFDAALAGDTATVQANTCSASQASVEQAASAFSAMAGGAGVEGVETDFTGITYTKTSETGDNAVVTIGGNVKVTVAGQTAEQPMGEIPMPLIKEGGAWKVCNL